MSGSVRRQLVLYFVLFALTLGLLFGGVTLLVFHRVEDRMIERRLQQMLSNPAQQKFSAIHFVGAPEAAPKPFPKRLAELPPGLYEWEDENHETHALLWADPKSGEPRVALASFPEAEVSELRLSFALLFGIAVTSLIALALARYLAMRIVAPIEQLTAQLAGGNFDQLALADLVGQRRDDEIGTLSRALKKASEEQVAAAERERRFLREASHELRTPITVIQGVSDLLQESVDPADTLTHKRLERLSRGLKRMNTSVLSLLAMARAEHRSTVKDMPPFSQQLEVLIEEARTVAQPQVTVDYELRTEPSDDFEASMLIVVLSNLTRNAVQHAKSGHVSVLVESQCAKVSDTGPGLPENLLHQLHGTGPHPDIGIGLATVQRICQRFGWEFEIECPAGGGTMVTVRLDLGEATPEK